MEQVRRGRLDDHRAERTYIALVLVVAVLTLPGLRMQPGIGGIEHLLGGLLDRPGLRGTVIIFEKTGHSGLAGHIAHLTATDAVRQDNCNAFGA